MTVTFDDLVTDLRALREIGLAAARRVSLAALEKAVGLVEEAEADPVTIETLLRRAVDKLEPGRLRDAARYTFGLVPGTRDWAAYDRRRKGAEIYRVGTDRFRKHYERIIVDEVADAILAICWSAAAGDRPESPRQRPPDAGRLTSSHTLDVVFGGRSVPISVHHRSIELLSDVDILVSPENVYFATATMFKSSVSAAIRRSAAVRGPAGEVADDVVPRELAAQCAPGLAVQPGTVLATSGGELRHQGVRRVYHAAVACPRAGTNEYDTDPAAVGLAVANIFRLARAENRALSPPLTSIALPLLGAGRGGLDPMTSLTWIWGTLEVELARDSPWHIHFVARNPDIGAAILARIPPAGGTAAD